MVTDEDHELGGASADHEHPAFDPEPVRELAADEPLTPMWLPALGLAIFVVFGVYLALGSDDAAANGAPTATATATAASPPPAPPGSAAVAPNTRRAVPRTARRPGATPTPPALDRLTPEQRKQLEERMRQMRQQGARPAPTAVTADPHEGHGH